MNFCIFSPSTPAFPFKAITFEAGFMIALSAVIGRLMGFVWSAISMMTTWAVSPTFSLTHMNLSLSMVRVVKEMFATLMPMLVSYNEKPNDDYD